MAIGVTYMVLGTILLFRERYPAWNQRLAARLRKAFSEVGMNADKRLQVLFGETAPASGEGTTNGGNDRQEGSR